MHELIDQIKIGWAIAKLLTRMTGVSMLLTVQTVLVWRLLYPNAPLKMRSPLPTGDQVDWIEVKWT